MEIEVKNLANYANFGWLKEIFETVIQEIRPDMGDKACLVITNSFAEAEKLLAFPGERLYLGVTGVYKEVGTEIETPYWRGGIISGIPHVFVKPLNIIKNQLTYEEVTAGFAHEISEMVAIKSHANLWSEFSPKQVELLEEWHPEIKSEWLLRIISLNIRDRLADKYSAEKGFDKEILSTFTTSFVVGFNKLVHPVIDRLPQPVTALLTIGFDRTLSLESAGFTDLATVGLNWWEKNWRMLPQFPATFFNYYQNFRKKLLSLGLTSNFLLWTFNMELLFQKLEVHHEP